MPIELQKVIADELNIPLSEVYGIVTFYTQFTLVQRANTNRRMYGNGLLCARRTKRIGSWSVN